MKIKNSLALVVLCLYGIFTASAAFASVNDDQVTSQKIKEADGTSGQNTNAGSGVKTGHIQDGAITPDKIADNAVTSGKVADGAVTTAKITDGAVTDAKITGPISGSKISSTGLNADTVDGQHASAFAPASHSHSQSQVTGLETALAGKSDVTHNHDTLYQQKYGKVAVVAQTGGDYTSPVAAMNDLATWCGTPSATNPCLLKIMPGIFDIGENSITMQPYVDLEGAGENMTIITGNRSSTGVGDWHGVIDGASYAEIRMFTVKHLGVPTGTAMGILNWANTSMKIQSVTVKIPNHGIGIYCWGGETLIKNATIENNFDYGIFNGQYSLMNVVSSRIISTASGSYGINNTGGSSTLIKDSTISVPLTSGNIGLNNSSTAVVIDSIVSGYLPVWNAGGAGNAKCLNTYDGNYNPLTCS